MLFSSDEERQFLAKERFLLQTYEYVILDKVTEFRMEMQKFQTEVIRQCEECMDCKKDCH